MTKGNNTEWIQVQTKLGANSGANVNIKANAPSESAPEHMELAVEAKKDALLREVNRTNLFYNTLRGLATEPLAVETAYDNIGVHALETVSPRNGKEAEEELIEFKPEQVQIRLLAAKHARAEFLAASTLVSEHDLQENGQTIQKLDEEVEQLTEPELVFYNRVLYYVKNEFYGELNASANEKDFVEFKVAVRDAMTKTPNGEQRRKSFGFALGYVSSGKGTALSANKISAVETGTEGILGHAKKFGYEHWTASMAPFDLLRGYGVFYPDVLMTVSTGLEMLERRGELDAEGKLHDAVFLSGFPRTAGQANSFFAGVDPDTISGAVFLTIDRETAFERTIFRLFEDAMSPEGMRKDDIESIASTQPDTYQVSQLLDDIRILADDFYKKVLKPIPETSTDERKRLLSEAKINQIRKRVKIYREQGYDLSMTKARWFADEKKKESMMAVLQDLGIKLQEIPVSHMTFAEEAAAVGNALLK